MSGLTLTKELVATSEKNRKLSPLKFITCGSVDDGKSTLIGRLLWDSKAVKSDQAEKLYRDGRRNNSELNLPEFALLLDGLQAEREQGITIDVAYRYFSTDKRSFIVVDCPGHEQYTRNMATGATKADLAVLLVDARIGILEQTKRHTMIGSMMGIKQFILAVNKIDLIDYDRERFEHIAREFSEFALSLGITNISSIPISALKGENVVNKDYENMAWYEGNSLLETLELANVKSKQSVGLRMPVQRVCRPNESFRGYQGTLVGGAVKPGDSVIILPSEKTANILQIVTFDLVRNAAVAGDAVTLVLDRNIDIARGDIISSIEAKPMMGYHFDANVIVLSENALVPNKYYWLKSACRRQKVMVEPYSAVDFRTGLFHDVERLELNNIGKVKLHFDEIAIFDSYEENDDMGAFIIIDPENNHTVAGGMISSKSEEIRHIGADNNDEFVLLSMPKKVAEKLQNSEIYKLLEEEIKQIPLQGKISKS